MRFMRERLIYAASRGIARSTNRKNRVLRAPATTSYCDAVSWASSRPRRLVPAYTLILRYCSLCLSVCRSRCEKT
jgi:hypothetical protein